MILNVEGNINRYYVQTLCMVFFPGATFGENELPGMGVPEVNVNVYNDEEGDVTAFVSMKLNDRTCEATETVRKDEDISVAEHAAIAVGRAVFAAGKELLGHIPPWGILTGVRPAKIASSILAEGRGVNEYIVLGATMISNLVLEYLYTRYVVYRNSCDTAIK